MYTKFANTTLEYMSQALAVVQVLTTLDQRLLMSVFRHSTDISIRTIERAY
jgi:hypothetical protein